MKHKVIVADDSLTIQKVIKITLAKEDFELIECLDDQKLHELCKEVKPTLVLLDFNLSENKTGYDLCRAIKNSDVDKILMLYGTFDTVDENLLDHCGANGHIVKPFEGNKFVSLCRQLIEDATRSEEDGEQDNDDDFDFQGSDQEEPIPEIDPDDQWVVNQPENSPVSSEDKTDEHNMSDLLELSDEKNSLETEVSDWGIDIPGVINKKKSSSIELPPVITDMPDEDDTSLPEETELEYPDVEEIRKIIKDEPKFTPIEVLKEVDEPKTEYSLDDTLGTKTEDEIRALEEQIANETEDDLWAADEVIGDEEEELEIEVELERNDPIPTPEISHEEILNALDAKIEEIVNARVEAIIEKVAWEVIPDLAENLISRELKNLAESAKN